MTFHTGSDDFNFEIMKTYFVKLIYTYSDGVNTENTNNNLSFSCSHCNVQDETRWTSSANGFSDLRVTDSTGDSLRPAITTLRNDSVLILWEDYRFSQNPNILGALVDNVTSTGTLKASGSQNWFDYNYNISGKSVAVSNDLFGRTLATYDRQQTNQTELPHTSLAYKVCDFIPETTAPNQNTPECVLPFSTQLDTIQNSLFNKARIKSDDVDYFTIDATSNVIPVVSKQTIKIVLIGSPELVAFRVKNENSEFSDWFNFEPITSEYQTEFSWSLSPSSGIKIVCIETITYAGKTNPITLNIICDLAKEPYDISITNEDGSVLPEFNGLSVVSASDAPKKLKIDIITQKKLDNPPIFDVVHQGIANLTNNTTELTSGDTGPFVYTGFVTIPKSDGQKYKDGLATIIPHFFPTIISTPTEKEVFNLFASDQQKISTETDNLASVRNQNTGKIGVQPDIRIYSDDPYFAFGDPGYTQGKNQ